MQKLLTSLAATAALALLASSAQAECAFHNMQITASADKADQSVVMSTYEPAPAPVAAAEETQQAAETECPADAKDCVPATE